MAPRTAVGEEIDAQEELFPKVHAVPFGSVEAEQAAELYRNGIARAAGRRTLPSLPALSPTAPNCGP